MRTEVPFLASDTVEALSTPISHDGLRWLMSECSSTAIDCDVSQPVMCREESVSMGQRRRDISSDSQLFHYGMCCVERVLSA